MGLEFAYPWALLLVPVGLAAVWLIDRRYRVRGLSLKRRVCLGMRMALVALLALCVAAPSLPLTSGQASRYVLVDVSDSTRDLRAQMLAVAGEALSALPDGERAGVIAYGESAMVEVPLSAEPSLSGLHTQPGGEASDLDGALRLASALLGESGGLTVISDGKSEVSAATVEMLTGAGVAVDVLRLETQGGADAQVSELTAPASAYEGQSVTLRAVVDATQSMQATLALYQNGELTATREVELSPGENRFAFTDVAAQSGIVTYEARLLTSDDTNAQNNSAAAYVRVSGAPKVLLAGTNAGVLSLLEAAGFQAEQREPGSMPLSAEGYLAYDAVVLDNVDYDWMNERQWQALDGAVRTLGRGLCVLGGDESYALGGYRGTLLEELLPVTIDVRNKLRMPALSLVIAIDKSGSMTAGQFGLTRIEVAKEAAMSAIEVLTERDFAGVIGFDSSAMWVVPFGPVTDLADIETRIGTMRADGGTAFYSALDEAYQALIKADTPQKHVIFLSDGQPADSGFENVALAMRKAGITLTTVAVGTGADARMMELLSTLGGGRSYQVGEFDNVPKIFTKETMLVGGSYVQNRTFTPVITEISSLTDFEGFPSLDGYLTTLEKETANVALVSDADDPLLAWWNAGAGTVLAWTSDARGAWTQNYLIWENAARFFGNMVSRVLPGESGQGTLTASVTDGQLVVSYAAADAESAVTTAEVVLPDGGTQSVALGEVAPGEYQGSVEATQQGAYAIRVTQERDGETVASREGGAVKGFSSEYDLRLSYGNDLEALAESTGGQTLSVGGDYWGTPVEAAVTRVSLLRLLCILCLCMLLVDIALRKLPWEDLLTSASRQLDAAREARQSRPAPPPKAPKPGRTQTEKARREAARQTANALLDAKRAKERK